MQLRAKENPRSSMAAGVRFRSGMFVVKELTACAYSHAFSGLGKPKAIKVKAVACEGHGFLASFPND
jgi:hypothetical protein